MDMDRASAVSRSKASVVGAASPKPFITFERISNKTEINNIDIDVETIEINNNDLRNKPVIPYQRPVPLGEKPTEFYIDYEAYESDKKTPNTYFKNQDVSYCRGYAILTINLNPVQYNPRDGRLFYHEKMTVTLDLEETGFVNQYYRNSIEDNNWVKTLVDNPEISNTYNAKPTGNR